MVWRHETALEHILGSRVRARLIEALLSDPRRSLYMRQLIRLSGVGVSFVRRELGELERMGLVHSRRTGREVYFDVDTSHPLAQPLRALVDAAARLDLGEGPPRSFERQFYERRGDEEVPCIKRGPRPPMSARPRQRRRL